MTREPLAAIDLPEPLTVLRIIDTSPSTNAQLIAEGGPDGTVLVAEHQTAGIGRLNRVWESPARAGLTLSVLLRPPVPRERWTWLPLLTGLAVTRTVKGAVENQVPVALKWPNDLLLGPDERKVAGILVQVAGDAAVIGIGLNVSLTEAELPVPTATSLLLAGALNLDRTSLLAALLSELAAEYRRWIRAPDDTILAGRYREQCLTLGREVRVSRVDGSERVAQALDIDEHGRLVLSGGDALDAGDVQHIRPV